MSSALNSKNQDQESLPAALRFVQRMIMADLECMIPARVVAYDSVQNIATIHPMIMITTLSPKGGDVLRSSRTEIPNVPVLSLGAGGFHIHFPIKQGDLGWLYAADRDIQLYLQSLNEQPAGGNGPSHNFKDSMFIPDVLRQYSLNSEDEGALVIQSTDSASRISIRPDNIKITTPIKVTLDTPLVECLHDLKVDGNATIVGTSLLEGRVTLQTGFASTGGTSSSVDHLTVGGVAMETHVHSDPQGGNVGPPHN